MRQTERPLGTTASKYGYLEALPDCYNPAAKYPLIIFLHGHGEIGNGIADLQKVDNTGLPAILKTGKVLELENFIILSIQSKTKSIPVTNINAFIDYAVKAYSVDENRIYGTGLSGGAIAADAYVKTCERFAAVVSIAGTTSTLNLGVAPNTPIWLFHGDADSVVSVNGSKNFYKALKANPATKEVKITIYPGVNHNSWDRTYNLSGMNTGSTEVNFGTSYRKDIRTIDQYDISIYEWFLKHAK